MLSTVYNEKEIRRKWLVLTLLLILLLVQCGIIIYFSSQPAKVSANLSRYLMGKLDWIPDFVPREVPKGENPVFSLHYIIRKLAHFYNFSLVGVLLYANRNYMERSVLIDFAWVSVGLFVAMFDETYQHFVPGRSGSFTDVCLDFSGVIFGFCFLKMFYTAVFKRGARNG